MEVMIQTAVLVTVILAVRKIFGEKLHVYIRYGLWLLVVCRLLIPVNLVDSPLGVPRIGSMIAEREADDNSSQNTAKKGQSVSAGRIADAESKGTADDIKTDNRQTDSLGTDGGAFDGNVNSYRGASDDGVNPNNGSSVGKVNLYSGSSDDGVNPNSGSLDGNVDVYSGISGDSANSDMQSANGSSAGILIELWGEVLGGTGVFRVIWIVGSILVGGFFATAHIRFRSRLYRKRRPCGSIGPDGEMIHSRPGARRFFWGNHEESGETAELPVYRVEKLESACLVGLIHPAVYIGSDMETDSDYFRYTVTHERVHYLHGDHIWAVIRVILVSVYWFHPFVWIAAVSSARDGEIACDHGTVRKLGEKDRVAYGTMLLDLCGVNSRKRMYSYGTMLRPGRSEMKERILRLARGNRSSLSAAVLVLLLMCIVAGCAFTKAPQNDEKEETGAVVGEVVELQDENVNGRDPQNGNASGSVDTSETVDPSENEEDSQNKNDTDIVSFDADAAISEQRQLTAVSAALSEETMFGADGPSLDYAGNLGTGGNNIIIFHDYFGLVVYDLTDRAVLRSLDLAHIDCHMTQGDNACQVSVSADGTSVWLHPRTRQYMFRYDVEENLLYQLPVMKSFETDLEAEDLFNRYSVTEDEYAGWHSNFLYEEYKDEKGLHTTYIYLYVSDKAEQRLGSLQCVWDDMVYVLCEDGVWPQQADAAGEFPYRYDGGVEDVIIWYDVPCVYSRISDSFGSRVHPATGDVIVHEGIDYAAEEGTEIVAAADGVVYEEGYSDEYGIYVVLLHANGDMTYYCHCQEITVTEEQRVKRGEKIATVGNTGRSTGAHLHFALSRNGEFIDPAGSMRFAEEE